jgi:hypothetical protein
MSQATGLRRNKISPPALSLVVAIVVVAAVVVSAVVVPTVVISAVVVATVVAATVIAAAFSIAGVVVASAVPTIALGIGADRTNGAWLTVVGRIAARGNVANVEPTTDAL